MFAQLKATWIRRICFVNFIAKPTSTLIHFAQYSPLFGPLLLGTHKPFYYSYKTI